MALYHTVNGSPVEVKKHQLMGPVGYTVTGSPTLSDGVLVGPCSNDNHLTISSAFSLDGNFEMVMKLKPGTSTSGGNVFAFGNGRYGYMRFSTSTLMFRTYSGDANTLTLSNTFDSDTYYYVRVKGNGGTITLGYSTDKSTWTETSKTAETFATSDYLQIGVAPYQTNSGYNGAGVDLNETYIKVNGKLWFYQPAPTKYIVKDDKLVFADRGLYLAGPVNYEVVGSPTIQNGIVSGFNENNYLRVNSAIDFTNNVEVCVKLIYNGYDSEHQQTICGIGNANRYGLTITKSGKLQILANATPYINTVVNSLVLVPGSTYYVKLLFSAQTFTYSYSTDGYNWTSNTLSGPYTFINATQYCFGNVYINNANEPFLGTIDLNETYIKVNDQLWFYGKNYASKNIAPVPANYTYGTTTTSAIGYVDMRTQVFTAAPSGATIGRDE